MTYTEELRLKKASESLTALSYLVNEKYSTAVYDKRDAFNFNIPYLCSNILSGPVYGVYISQLVRIGRICSDYSDFALRHYKLTERLIHQGYRYSDLYRSFHKFAIKHRYIIQQWIDLLALCLM